MLRFRLYDFHLNTHGTAHGGLLALIVDMSTTLAVMTVAYGHQEGVSTDLHCSYLAAVELGKDYLADARVVKAGRRLVYTEMSIAPWNDPGKVAVKALQTKMLTI